jgi:hypothetical protein
MLKDTFDQYARGELSTSEFDDALWLALCNVVNDRDEAAFAALPTPVRLYFASRLVEWDVGNGGFAQAAYNVPHLFALAREGYAALGLPAAAALIARAEQLIAEGHGDFDVDLEDDIGEAFDEFAESPLAELDDEIDEAGWWATEQRTAYVLEHRADFEGLA